MTLVKSGLIVLAGVLARACKELEWTLRPCCTICIDFGEEYPVLPRHRLFPRHALWRLAHMFWGMYVKRGLFQSPPEKTRE